MSCSVIQKSLHSIHSVQQIRTHTFNIIRIIISSPPPSQMQMSVVRVTKEGIEEIREDEK